MSNRERLSPAVRAWLARFRHRTANINALSTGYYPTDPCATCKGKGSVPNTAERVPGEDDIMEDCEDCNASGRTCACAECPSERNDDAGDEGGFSWRDCDTCGSSLGGNRYAAHGLVSPKRYARRTELLHLDVCTDCLVFIANGDLPGED